MFSERDEKAVGHAQTNFRQLIKQLQKEGGTFLSIFHFFLQFFIFLQFSFVDDY